MRQVNYISPSYLQRAAGSRAIKEVRRLAVERLEIGQGSHVLDIGCGPGTLTVRFARIVGRKGAVVGIDLDPQMIRLSNERAHRLGLIARTTHQVADCTNLPFKAGTFDACYCERVLQHLSHPKPAYALSEAIRVTRPGGRIVFADTDWGSFSIDCDEPRLERRIVSAHASRFWNPFSGRVLPRLFSSLGLRNVEVDHIGVAIEYFALLELIAPTERTAIMTGAITRAEWRRWRQSLNRTHVGGGHQSHVLMVLASARRP
jgi:ubiquinone/menaquinone biosynthesis C-methylase UbiE